MARYHPPVTITSNAAPAISADLMYEEHGKCGDTRVIENERIADANVFDAAAEDTGNAWKIVFLHETTVIDFRAKNMETTDSDRLGSGLLSKTYAAGIEIMADIKYVKIDDSADDGLAILYLDCTQS